MDPINLYTTHGTAQLTATLREPWQVEITSTIDGRTDYMYIRPDELRAIAAALDNVPPSILAG